MKSRREALPWRICITSGESDVSALKARINRMPRFIHELRIDYLKAVPADFAELTAGPPKTIITLRPRREGGCFTGSEKRRIAILERALKAVPDYIDVEFSTAGELKKKLYALPGRRTKIILSYHDFTGIPRNIRAVIRRMEREPADMIKLALRVDDASAIPRLLDISKAVGKPKIIIGMGAGGVLTRILPERFGSAMAYAPPSPELSTADGQLGLDELDMFRKKRGSRPRLLGIVGNRGALNSHGLRVYNQLFAGRCANMVYVPVITSSLSKTMKTLRLLRFRGVSVTQPHKQEAFELCDVVSREAKATGAVNTMKLSGGKLYGTNTDYLAARKIFSDISHASGQRASGIAIVGAGGAAQAVAAAAAGLGWHGRIFNRTKTRARKLAEKYGFEARPLVELEEESDFDVLVNCTSVGMDSDACIIHNARHLKGKFVVDLVSHPVRTTLLTMAKKAGGKPVSGVHFWALQGREQMKILADINLPLKIIEKVLILCE